MTENNITEQQVEETISQNIYIIRNRRVMIDSDLAKLYGVLTKNFNKAVQRNLQRFPNDFMFQLTNEENMNRFQFGTGSQKHRGSAVSTICIHRTRSCYAVVCAK